VLALKNAAVFCERQQLLMLVAGLGGLAGPEVGA